MDISKSDIKKVYFKYLATAFGSTLISTIYSFVDMAMVGRYYGPDGTAALAVISPIWNVIFSLGLLTGIGGSVLFSIKRSGNPKNSESENEYFTAALIFSIVLAAATTAFLWLYEKEIFAFCGADETILPIALLYMKPIKFVFPIFLLSQLISAFLRNDNDPTLATIAVISGGVFNIFGDYFCVFVLDLGAFGAGLATAIGAVISFMVLITHFFKKTNTLKLVKPKKFFNKIKSITVTGFSSFFIDVAMGILAVLFNRQIMKYLGTTALAVYGTIINISTFVQCCAYSVGQASQPIFSANYGAGHIDRIKKTLKLAIITSFVFGAIWTTLSLVYPEIYVKIFMEPTPEIYEIAPAIIRTYAISFILLPFNIFSTYYFQSILQPKKSFVVSVMRGLVISSALILLLPLIAPKNSIWLTMPITEAIVTVYVVISVISCTRSLENKIAKN